MSITLRIGLFGVVLGAVSLGYSVYTQMKFNKSLINKIAEDLSIYVPRETVDNAIEIAVKREVSDAVKIISRQAVYDIRNDIRKEVKKTVDSSFSTIKEAVSAEVTKQVANINMFELKRDVKEKAKERIVEKFDENLDSLLSEFNNNLANVSKIYNSIADSISKKESETLIKIGV